MCVHVGGGEGAKTVKNERYGQQARVWGLPLPLYMFSYHMTLLSYHMTHFIHNMHDLISYTFGLSTRHKNGLKIGGT